MKYFAFLAVLFMSSCEEGSLGGTSSSQSAGGSAGGFGGTGGCSKNLLSKVLASTNSHKVHYWRPEYTATVCREIARHPALLHGLTDGKEVSVPRGRPVRGKRRYVKEKRLDNPLRGLCNNFQSLSAQQRYDAYAAVAIALANGESGFNSADSWSNSGRERSKSSRARALLQIDWNAKRYGCFQNGKGPEDPYASLECSLKIMDSKYQKENLPIANDEWEGTLWSVLKPRGKLKSRFMATFKMLAPQCSTNPNFTVVKSAIKPAFEVNGSMFVENNSKRKTNNVH